MSGKARGGNFFEDFHLGDEIVHATPRTVTEGDQALYNAIYGPRFPFISSDEFARAAGLIRAPIDGLLTFHVVFGKSVPDISLNAIANLGYADCLFQAPTYPGDTISASSRVPTGSHCPRSCWAGFPTGSSMRSTEQVEWCTTSPPSHPLLLNGNEKIGSGVHKKLYRRFFCVRLARGKKTHGAF